MRFVLDCSVTMSWLFDDESDRYTDAVLDALAHGTAIVPALWPLEVANALLTAERRRRVTQADALGFLEMLGALPVMVDPMPGVEDIPLLIAIGRRQKLSAYDATYLYLAMRERLPLATRDIKLSAAAKASGIAMFARTGTR